MKKTNKKTLNVDVRDEKIINEELYVGMIVSDADITNQYGLSMLYNLSLIHI